MTPDCNDEMYDNLSDPNFFQVQQVWFLVPMQLLDLWKQDRSPRAILIQNLAVPDGQFVTYVPIYTDRELAARAAQEWTTKGMAVAACQAPDLEHTLLGLIELDHNTIAFDPGKTVRLNLTSRLLEAFRKARDEGKS